MKHVKILLLLVSTSFILCACPSREDGNDTIIIKNNSDRAIRWQPRLVKKGEIEDKYNCQYLTAGELEAHSSHTFQKERGYWDEGLDDSRYFQIMIIDRDSAVKHTVSQCDTFRKYVPVLQTYRLTLEDLKQRNWTVVYPD